MSLLALGTASTYLGDTAFSGATLPAAEAHALTGFTGFTFVNSPEGLVVFRITVGSAGAGNATILAVLAGQSNKVVALANSTEYVSSPIDNAIYSNMAGLVTVNLSVVTGNAVGVYLLPANTPLTSFKGLHNPFESTPGAEDR